MCCSLVQVDLELGVLLPHAPKCYVTNTGYLSQLRTYFLKYALRVIAEHCGLGTENREQPFPARFVPNDVATACQMSEENGLSLPWASITLPTNFPKGSCIRLCPRNAAQFPFSWDLCSTCGCAAFSCGTWLFLSLVCSEGDAVQFRGTYLGAETVNKQSSGQQRGQQGLLKRKRRRGRQVYQGSWECSLS